MRVVRGLLVVGMLLVAVSGYAQSPPDLTLGLQADSPVVESPQLAPPAALGASVSDESGAGIAASVGHARKGGKRVLWDLTHGVYMGYEPSADYTSLVSDLNLWGFTVTTTAAGLANVDLSQYDILVLNLGSAWYSAYTAAEVNIVKDFVADGGGLLIMGDNTASPNANLQPVATEFGTTLGSGDVDDTINISWPTSVPGHPLFTGVTSISLFNGGQLIAAPPSASAAVDASGHAAVTIAGYEAGRVVTIGDLNLWDNDRLGSADNDWFAFEAFGWLSFSQKRVLWDLTHGVYLGYEPSDRYSFLVYYQGLWGHHLTTTTAGLTNVDLSQYDVLVLNVGSAWDSAYTASEVDAIKDFVAGGGGLLIMSDNSGVPNGNLQPVASAFGTTLGGVDVTGKIPNFLPAHALFAGTSWLTLVFGGQLTASAPSVTAAWDDSGRSVVNVAGYGNGRVMVMGDVNLWENESPRNPYDWQFAINAFNWLSCPQRRVLWDLSHGAYSGYEPSGAYSSLVTWLGAYGHRVTTTTAGLLNVDLSRYDALVLNLGSAFNSAYTGAEADRVFDFVDAGAGLVIMGDQPVLFNDHLNPVATLFGTTVGVGEIDESITNFSGLPLFAGVSSLFLAAGGQLSATGASTVAAWDASDRAAVTVSGQGTGRVVAAGDIDLWTNDYLTFADNQRFATNVFDSVMPYRREIRAPSLSTGAFQPHDPAAYGPGTEFRFFVHYYDGDGEIPSVIRVFIDGVGHPMSLSSGLAYDGFYEYRTTLPTGAHDYYFYAEDGFGGTDRLPDVNRLAGPFVCRATINDNAVWTSSPSVSVRVWGKGAAKVYLKNKYDTTWQGTFAYTPTSASSVVIPWTLAAGADGPRAVYALCTTSKARPSNISADTIILDTTDSPVISGFFINDRAATTSTLNVTVKVYVNCATDVRFKNKYDDPWGAWQPLSQCNYGQFAWRLAAGSDGPRAVYVQARDHHGYVSNVRCDTIELNTGGS